MSRRSSGSSADRDMFYLDNRRKASQGGRHRPTTAHPPLGFCETSPVLRGRPSVATSRDDMELVGLRGMISDYQQQEKLNAAKARREAHKRLRTGQARSANYEAMQKSCIALQTRWLDDEMRKSQSIQLQETHKEDVMIRKVGPFRSRYFLCFYDIRCNVIYWIKCTPTTCRRQARSVSVFSSCAKRRSGILRHEN